jgi:hypothetical protein
MCYCATTSASHVPWPPRLQGKQYPKTPGGNGVPGIQAARCVKRQWVLTPMGRQIEARPQRPAQLGSPKSGEAYPAVERRNLRKAPAACHPSVQLLEVHRIKGTTKSLSNGCPKAGATLEKVHRGQWWGCAPVPLLMPLLPKCGPVLAEGVLTVNQLPV